MGRRRIGCWGLEQLRYTGPVEVSPPPFSRLLCGRHCLQMAACQDRATGPHCSHFGTSEPLAPAHSPALLLHPQGHGAGKAVMGPQGPSTAGPPAKGDPGTPRELWGGLARMFLAGLGRCVIPRGGEGQGFKRALVPGRKQRQSSGTAGTCQASPSCDHRGQVGEVWWRGAWLGVAGLCRGGGHSRQRRSRRSQVCKECGIACACPSGWAAARCRGGTVGVGQQPHGAAARWAPLALLAEHSGRMLVPDPGMPRQRDRR